MSDPKFLAWIDLETTGTDRVEDPIIEVALIVTGPTWPFNPVDRTSRVVQPSGQQWSHRMNPTVLKMHTINGLLADAFASPDSLADVDSDIARMLNGLGKPHEFMIAGSGVAHFDRAFIAQQMPKVDRFLQYGALDVGVLRRAMRAIGRADLMEPDPGDKTHRAMDDIEAHLAEMRHYGEVLADA